MLTAKQEKFCQNIAKGMNQADAYRDAYGTKKMKDKTIWENASRLMRNSKVKARVEQLKEKITDDIKYTVVESFNSLCKAQELALNRVNPFGKPNPDLANFIKAEELKGKLKGLYVEKKELSGGLELTPFEIKIVE